MITKPKLRRKAQLQILSKQTGINLGTLTEIYDDECHQDWNTTVMEALLLSESVKNDLNFCHDKLEVERS